MATYLIESTACLAIMLLVYRFTLARTSLHRFKRFYLLACLAIPLMLPLAQVDIYYGQAQIIEQEVEAKSSIPTYIQSNTPDQRVRNEYLSTEKGLDTVQPQSVTDWSLLPFVFYVLIIMALLIRFLINIHRIRRLAKTSEYKDYKGHKVILLKGSATAYSFFQLIFIGEEDYNNPVTREHLLSHELAHAHDWHSLDIILLELFRVMLWFNPLYYLLSKYIRLNHEYIADSQVLTQFGDSRTYQKLILNFASRAAHNTPLVSPSDFSFIKNRFSMMHKSTSPKAAAMRVLLLTIAIAGTFFTLAVNLKPRPAVFVAPIQKAITPVTTKTPTGLPLDSVRYSTNPGNSGANLSLTLDDFYPGIDITARQGRTVIATADGTVAEAGNDAKKYGNYVLINHDNQVQTLYASLSRVSVQKGQQIKSGDLLGIIGTSMPTAAISHSVDRVHYAISKSGEWVNPYRYINLPAPRSANEEETAVPWAYPRALDIPTVRDTRPDISPIDAPPGEYMTFTGAIPSMPMTKSSLYDSSLGTEFIVQSGTVVKATASGRVSKIVTDHEGYGNYVKITHDDLHETFYAKLDEVSVKPGQTLAKGETIGRIGNDNEVFGRLHYKILRKGISMSAVMYSSGSRSQSPMIVPFSPKDEKTTFKWQFPAGFRFSRIAVSRDEVVFTKRSGSVITKKATELSASQKKSLLSLERQPYPREAKRPVPEEVYSRWHNPKVYQIRIDGKLTPSSEMTKYHPEDFAHSTWVVVSKAVKERKGHAFQLSLYTPEYYEKLNQDHRQRVNDWKAKTKELLSEFQEL